MSQHHPGAQTPTQHPVPRTARRTASPLPQTLIDQLTPTARVLFDRLQAVALEVSNVRYGDRPAPTQVHFFCPGEIVTLACGLKRTAMYRALRRLEALELVEGRAHYVTHRDRTKADGMVWAVKMHPERRGPVKVPYDALKASYRCLSADIAAGRTAYAQTRTETGQSKEPPTEQVGIQMMLAWSLPPLHSKTPLSMTVRPELFAVRDVATAERGDRGAVVDGAAHALAAGLRDPGGLMFYRWLLWQLLRLRDRTGASYFDTVLRLAERAAADAAEGFARGSTGGSGGALFVSRLKGCDWYDELVRASGRVGSRPAA